MDLYKSDTTKYDIPLNHLEFSYIENCSDVKELEKIVKLLRSGHEGKYPDLEKLAEDTLAKYNPDSRVLRVAKPLPTKADLNKQERDGLETELKDWAAEMRCQEENLAGTGGSEGEDLLPPVRGDSTNIPIDKKSTEAEERSKRRVLPRDHREWDKIDIEAELAKVDGEKPKPNKVLPKDVQVTDKVKTRGLTEEEKILRANREKDKGNEAFRAGDFEEALIYYNRSICIGPTAAAYNNRAQSYVRMERWKEAYRDCNKVLDIEPQNFKAVLRRSVASQGLHDYVHAKNDLITVLHKDPHNKRAKQILEEVEESLRKQKVKGRRMVIEEVDGSDTDSDSDSDTDTVAPTVNGHVTGGELPTADKPGHSEENKVICNGDNRKSTHSHGSTHSEGGNSAEEQDTDSSSYNILTADGVILNKLADNDKSRTDTAGKHDSTEEVRETQDSGVKSEGGSQIHDTSVTRGSTPECPVSSEELKRSKQTKHSEAEGTKTNSITQSDSITQSETVRDTVTEPQSTSQHTQKTQPEPQVVQSEPIVVQKEPEIVQKEPKKKKVPTATLR